VFAEGAAAEEAQSAGADVVGADALVAEIQESKATLNFWLTVSSLRFAGNMLLRHLSGLRVSVQTTCITSRLSDYNT
jgi:ribosomal protein L1